MSAETKNFVAGNWVATGSNFDSVNPATGELVSRCAEASQQELDAAVAAACDAFPAWRKTPPPRRAEILFRVAELLQARKDDLARWITLEMGKVTMEARGDVQEAIDMARYMAGEGRRMFGQTAPSELPDKFCMSLRDPISASSLSSRRGISRLQCRAGKFCPRSCSATRSCGSRQATRPCARRSSWKPLLKRVCRRVC